MGGYNMRLKPCAFLLMGACYSVEKCVECCLDSTGLPGIYAPPLLAPSAALHAVASMRLHRYICIELHDCCGGSIYRRVSNLLTQSCYFK